MRLPLNYSTSAACSRGLVEEYPGNFCLLPIIYLSAEDMRALYAGHPLVPPSKMQSGGIGAIRIAATGCPLFSPGQPSYDCRQSPTNPFEHQRGVFGMARDQAISARNTKVATQRECGVLATVVLWTTQILRTFVSSSPATFLGLRIVLHHLPSSRCTA